MNEVDSPIESEHDTMQPVEGVCVCVFSSHSFRTTSSSLDVPAGSHKRKVTQDFSSTFFLRCVP